MPNYLVQVFSQVGFPGTIEQYLEKMFADGYELVSEANGRLVFKTVQKSKK